MSATKKALLAIKKEFAACSEIIDNIVKSGNL